jgi:hypothetical protein
MIRAASNSVASLCVVPMQDALGLGSDARMNVPSRERKGTGAGVLAPFACARSWQKNWPRSPKSPTGFRSRCRGGRQRRMGGLSSVFSLAKQIGLRFS